MGAPWGADRGAYQMRTLNLPYRQGDSSSVPLRQEGVSHRDGRDATTVIDAKGTAER